MLLPILSICQSTDTCLSPKQMHEIRKGLEQNNALKTLLNKCENLNTQQKQLALLSEQTIQELTSQVQNRQDAVENLQHQNTLLHTELQQASQELYNAKRKNQKRFSLGIQSGYGITPTLQPTPYLGISIQVNLIRF